MLLNTKKGNTEHIILDNLNNLSDYRGDFAKLQTLASAVANKFNKPVTIPSFLLMKDDATVQNVKQELIGNNINPMIIENLECNDNASNIPNRLLKDNSLFQQSSSASTNPHVNNCDYQKATHPGPNSQNHYLIQSLQSDPIHSNQQLKENQPIQGAPIHQDHQNIQQRFYTDSPIQQSGLPQQMQPGSGSDSKKSTKARKSVVPKNPNTPKRRKTICSKEKINQMPTNNIQLMTSNQNESLSESIVLGANSLATGKLILYGELFISYRPLIVGFLHIFK